MADVMGNIMQNARFVGGVNMSLAAAGDSQESAAAAYGAVNVVTEATATSADGVRLPGDRAPGDMVMIINTTGEALDVFPSTGGAINGASANAALALAANKSALYISIGGGDWGAVVSA